jgi:hypothetical protein
MESRIARKLRLRYAPVARAARGERRRAAAKPSAAGAAAWGWALAMSTSSFPGGEDGFCHFFSIGNDQWETGRQMAEKVKPHMTGDSFDHFMHGERYMKIPGQVKRFIRGLPITDIPAPLSFSSRCPRSMTKAAARW